MPGIPESNILDGNGINEKAKRGVIFTEDQMRIIQQGNVFKIQEQKFNLCSREPYWKTLKHRDADESGMNEFDYEFSSQKDAEEFINKHFQNNLADNILGLKL